LFLFNSHGDCLAAKLRPGNVHGVEDWDEFPLPEIERQQAEFRRGPTLEQLRVIILSHSMQPSPGRNVGA
jgi:hypothetical protein